MPDIKQGKFKKRVAIQVSLEADVVKELDKVRGLFSRSGVAAEMIKAGISARHHASQYPAEQGGAGDADF